LRHDAGQPVTALDRNTLARLRQVSSSFFAGVMVTALRGAGGAFKKHPIKATADTGGGPWQT